MPKPRSVFTRSFVSMRAPDRVSEGDERTAVARAEAAQTLLRGLRLLEAVADGTHDLMTLADRTGLARSTAHRLLAALVREGYLRHSARTGYDLGSKVGWVARKAS